MIRRATGRTGAVRFRVVAAAAGAALALAAGTPALAAGSGPGNAPGWRVIKTFPAEDTDLDGGVVAFSNGTAWVGGSTPAQTPVLYHFTAGRWHTSGLPGAEGTFVDGLSASSVSNVWAALANEPDVAHLTRHGWVLTSFTQGSLEVLITAVVTFGPKNTWVFYTALNNTLNTHAGYAVHFNGSSWHKTKLPGLIDANSNIGLVSASSPTNIWALSAVGNDYASLHYDGHGWHVVPMPQRVAPPSQTVFTRQVLALSPTNVFAALFTSTNTTVGPIVLLHWDGTRWRKISDHLPPGALAGPMAPDGHGGIWLAADTPAFKPEMLRYSDKRWTTYQGPHSPVKGQALMISSLVHIPGTTSSVLGAGTVSLGLGSSDGGAVVKYGS